MKNSLFANLGIIDRDTRLSLMEEAKKNYEVFDIVGQTLIKDAFGYVGVGKFMIYDQVNCILRPVGAAEYYNAKFYKHVVIVNRDKETKHLKFHVLTNVELIDEMFDMSNSTWKMNVSSRNAAGGENIECGDMFTFEASKTFNSTYEAIRYIQSGIVDTVLTSDYTGDEYEPDINLNGGAPQDLFKMPGL